MGPPLLEVVAGILSDGDDRVLITRRPEGKHLAGYWEFPGGKRAATESPRAALVRELREELGVEVLAARPLIRYRHDYPDRSVELDVWRVTAYRGTPTGLEDQALAWLPVAELETCDLLPADGPIVAALRLPPLCAVTGAFGGPDDFRRRLMRALAAGAGLVQLRVPGASAAELIRLGEIAVNPCRDRGALLVANSRLGDWPALDEAGLFDGLHLPAREHAALADRPVPDGRLLGASCHDEVELRRAQRLGADYAVLGAVSPTPSHPGIPGMGWPRFARLAAPLRLPVYAVGGLSPDDLERAWQAGAQGVAAISALWPPGD